MPDKKTPPKPKPQPATPAKEFDDVLRRMLSTPPKPNPKAK